MKPTEPGRYWVTSPNNRIIDGNKSTVISYEFVVQNSDKGLTARMVDIAGAEPELLSDFRDDLIWEKSQSKG